MDADERRRLLPRPSRASAGNRALTLQKECPDDDPRQWRMPSRMALVFAGCLLVGSAFLGFVSIHRRRARVSIGVIDNQELDPQEEGNLYVPGSGHHFSAGGTPGKAAITRMDGAEKSGQSGSNSNSSKSSSGTADKPNVVFVLIDDVGMNDIGLYSSDLAELTPFMNSLIDDGVHITRYYTNHICTPARASLMSGRDTFRTGMQFEELTNAMPWGLPLDEVTLAERFKAAGYATHMVGKWNLGIFTEDYYPFNRGFDTFLGYFGPEEHYYTHLWAEKHDWHNASTFVSKDFGYGDKDGIIDLERNTTRWGPDLVGQYSTSLTADRALQIASDHQASLEAGDTEDPLFMYLAFQAAHSPLEPPREVLFSDEELETLSSITSESTTRMNFAKILYFLDISLKRMIDELDAMGMMDNTLLVVASDNGGCPSDGGSNFPFRGFKHTLFEGGVRTPAFVYSKSESIIPAEARGTTYDGMMHVTDWTPTLANISGIPTGEMGKPLSGYDQWSAIVGQRPESEPPVRNEVVLGRSSYEFEPSLNEMVTLSTPRGAFIYDGWKIIIGDKCTGWFSFNPTENILYDPNCPVGECATCDNNCAYTMATKDKFLFDLNNDPFERINLIETMPEKFEEINARFDAATVDEVLSNFKTEDPRSVEQWERYNNWVVAWL